MTRTELCACGGWITAPPDDYVAVVTLHVAGRIHQEWRRELGVEGAYDLMYNTVRIELLPSGPKQYVAPSRRPTVATFGIDLSAGSLSMRPPARGGHG